MCMQAHTLRIASLRRELVVIPFRPSNAAFSPIPVRTENHAVLHGCADMQAELILFTTSRGHPTGSLPPLSVLAPAINAIACARQICMMAPAFVWIRRVKVYASLVFLFGAWSLF
ncbi:hypothetical protein MTO96_049432 [Rhipicephalus appendiculatus]